MNRGNCSQGRNLHQSGRTLPGALAWRLNLEKPVLGHIDCPACGAPQGMRIIHDKNIKPFGHCDDCNAQLRVGGNGYREKKFAALYPWAAKSPVTVTAEKVPDIAPLNAEKSNEIGAASVPVSVPTTKKETPIKPRSAFSDAVAFLSAGK